MKPASLHIGRIYFRQLIAAFASVALVASMLAPSAVLANTKKDNKEREAQRRMQQMQQQMEAEKADMQAQFDQEKKSLEDKNAQESAELKATLSTTSHRNASLQAELATLKKEKMALDNSLHETQSSLETTRNNLNELTQRYQTAQNDLKSGDSQRKEMSTLLIKRQQTIDACDTKNAKLYDFGMQLINMYEPAGIVTAALQNEPFTKIKRVELEAILQDQRDKLDEQHVTPATN